MKKTAIFLALIVLIQSCATTTVITSNIPESEVYIGGKLKGTTPYYHKDLLPLGFSRKVELKKEGYETYNGKISKFDRANGMAIFAGFLFAVPILWAGTYDHCYQFDMAAEGKSEPIQSNFLNISENFLTSKGYSSIYLGQEDGKHVLFNQDRIHYLDGDMNFLETVQLADDIEGEPIDGYIENGKKHMVVFNYNLGELSFVTINGNDNSSTKDLQKIQFTDDIVEEDLSYGYMRNKQTNEFVCYTSNSLTIYNESGESQETYKSENDYIAEAELLADGRVLLLQINKNDEFFLVEYANETATNHPIENTIENNWAFPRLSVNEADGKVFVSTLLKDKDGRKETIKKAVIYSAKLSDLTNFSLKNVTLEEISKNQYLINRGVISDAESDILCLELQWKIITETTSQTGTGSTRTRYSEQMVTGNMVMVNFSKKETKQKKLIKTLSSSVHRPKLSGQFFLKDGNIYCVYNSQINGRTFLTQSVLDTDLNYKTLNYRDSYKEDNVLLHPSRAYQTSTGEIIFTLQYKTKLGMAKSSF
jgi:hypothetical protein